MLSSDLRYEEIKKGISLLGIMLFLFTNNFINYIIFCFTLFHSIVFLKNGFLDQSGCILFNKTK